MAKRITTLIHTSTRIILGLALMSSLVTAAPFLAAEVTGPTIPLVQCS
jgi:hypothetical protein